MGCAVAAPESGFRGIAVSQDLFLKFAGEGIKLMMQFQIVRLMCSCYHEFRSVMGIQNSIEV